MKNERVALNLNELETVAGGAEYNFDLFDPEDKLTRQQMELTIAAITYCKFFGGRKEELRTYFEVANKDSVYDFDIAYYADKYWDVEDFFKPELF